MGKSDAIFEQLEKALQSQGKQMVDAAKAVFCFKVTGGQTYVLNLKDGTGSLTKGEGKADCTITIKDDDFVALASGKMNGMQAYMQGKMKLAGNMMLAQKLQKVFAALKK